MRTFRLSGLGDLRVVAMDVDAERFAELRTAHTNLFHVLGVEEKYAILNENYFELQEDLLRTALRARGMLPPAWNDSITAIRMFDRRMVNLLSTARLYRDQVKHHLAAMYGRKSAVHDRFETAFKSASEDLLGFRALDELRDYAQHRDLPTHLIVRGSKLLDDGSGRKCSYAEIFLEVARLLEDARFDKVVAKELASRGVHVDLNVLVAEYMTGLSRIHASLREALNADLASWEAILAGALSDVKSLSRSGELVGCKAEALEEGKVVEELALFMDFMQRRRALRSSNLAPINYVGRIVSSARI